VQITDDGHRIRLDLNPPCSVRSSDCPMPLPGICLRLVTWLAALIPARNRLSVVPVTVAPNL
jgi:hypothetical protein